MAYSLVLLKANMTYYFLKNKICCYCTIFLYGFYNRLKRVLVNYQ